MALPAFFVVAGMIFKKIFSVIAEFFIFLFKNPKILLALVVAIAILFSYYKVSKHIKGLESQIAKLEEEKVIWVQSKEIYESNQRQLVQVNRENQAVLETMQVTKVYWGKNIVDLKKASDAAIKQMDQILEKIKNAPPESDGVVSPILKSTIEEIEKSRKDRNKLWKQN